MKVFTRVLKNRHSRSAGEASLGASASTPNSGFAFVDNSQGASAAIVELSNAIGFALDNLDSEADFASQSELKLQQLEEKASEYGNSRLSHATPREFPLSQCDVELSSLAWAAASAVYKKAEVHDEALQNQGLNLLEYIDRSIGGTTKSAAIFKTSSRALMGTDSVMDESSLIVAIRGSKHKVPDHMVNANYKDRPLKSLVNGTIPGVENTSDLRAHSGFMSVAEAMTTLILEIILRSGSKNILFTGHSAGGAVATLLYLRNLSQLQGLSFRLSLITFGAPPVINQSISLPQSPPNTKVWNFINEYDIVARADSSYTLSLADMFRSIYNQPPLSERLIPPCHPEECWPLPQPDYYHVGERVILHEVHGQASADHSPELESRSTVHIQASLLDENAFARLLFCNSQVHRRPEYASKIKQLSHVYGS